MNTDLTNAAIAADDKRNAQCDSAAKHILSNKFLLAHILANTIDEFKGMMPKDIVPLIEGEPNINTIPVDNGLTNLHKGSRIAGITTENSDINEGIIYYDIVFYVRMLDGISQIIINLEAQKNNPKNYFILNRAIFYECRLISSEKGRDFTGMNYNDIKRAYSIWLCMDMQENYICHYHLIKDDIIGHSSLKKTPDIFNIIFIGLNVNVCGPSNVPSIHHLLGTMFSSKLTADEKLNIINKQYDIPITDTLKGDVNVMGSISDMYFEHGEAHVIMNLYHNGYSPEKIAEMTSMDLELIKKIIYECEPAMT